MNSSWQEFLGASGARFENGTLADFGQLEAELLAAREATVIAPLPHLALLDFSGDDARSFLHNQVTSDVNHLEADAAQYSAWCTAKGRMLASFLLYRHAGGYQAVLAADLLETVRLGLQKYVLRSKVRIAASNAHELIGIAGARADAALQHAGLPVPATALHNADFDQGTVIRLDDTRLLVVVSSDTAPGYWKKLAEQARPVGAPVWTGLEIDAGIPSISAATKEEFVPQMANFDKIGGVSFHKGCYPGQEIVARAQYLGKVKRHLYRVGSLDALAAGAAIYAPDSPEHPCGMIVNAAPVAGGGFRALAVIQEDFVAADNLEAGAPGGQRLTIAASV